MAKNYRSKSVWTLFQRKLFNNQTVWPVIFGFTGPICARALKSFHLLELRAARASRLASKAANAENDESTPTMGGIVSRSIDEVLKPCLKVPLGGVQEESALMSF